MLLLSLDERADGEFQQILFYENNNELCKLKR